MVLWYINICPLFEPDPSSGQALERAGGPSLSRQRADLLRSSSLRILVKSLMMIVSNSAPFPTLKPTSSPTGLLLGCRQRRRRGISNDPSREMLDRLSGYFPEPPDCLDSIQHRDHKDTHPVSTSFRSHKHPHTIKQPNFFTEA